MSQRASYWRTRVQPLVAKALQNAEGNSDKAFKRALLEAYPFGRRTGWPYKVWLDEIRRQRGLPRRTRGGGEALAKGGSAEAPGQLSLIELP